MPARLALLTAVVLGVIACGPGGRAASNAPASRELAAVDGSLWVAIPNVNSVLRIDPARDEIVGSIPFPKENSGPCGLTATSGTLWETSCDNNLLSRIDPATNRITRSFDLGGSPSDGAAAGDTLWIAVGGDDNHPTAPAFLLHLRDDGTVLQRYALGNGFRPGAVALAFGAIWVTDEMRPLLMRIPNPA